MQSSVLAASNVGIFNLLTALLILWNRPIAQDRCFHFPIIAVCKSSSIEPDQRTPQNNFQKCNFSPPPLQSITVIYNCHLKALISWWELPYCTPRIKDYGMLYFLTWMFQQTDVCFSAPCSLSWSPSILRHPKANFHTLFLMLIQKRGANA